MQHLEFSGAVRYIYIYIYRSAAKGELRKYRSLKDFVACSPSVSWLVMLCLLLSEHSAGCCLSRTGWTFRERQGTS